MILRRLSQSLKEQNWAAIWIEFVLLVAGVFLGIQVANWNDEQKNSVSSRDIIENLYADYTTIEADGHKNLKYLNESIKASEDVLNILRNTANKANLEEIHQNLSLIFSLPNALPESTTQKELMFSGQMGLIQNNQLRTTLVQISAQLTNAQYTQQSRREFVRPYISSVMRLNMLLVEGYPLQQAIDLAGGKPEIQIGLHSANLILRAEMYTLEQTLKSIQNIREKLNEQRKGDSP